MFRAWGHALCLLLKRLPRFSITFSFVTRDFLLASDPDWMHRYPNPKTTAWIRTKKWWLVVYTALRHVPFLNHQSRNTCSTLKGGALKQWLLRQWCLQKACANGAKPNWGSRNNIYCSLTWRKHVCWVSNRILIQWGIRFFFSPRAKKTGGVVECMCPSSPQGT